MQPTYTTPWCNRRTVQKGNVGERIVETWLTKRGYVPYHPPANGAHPFDWLVATADKRKVFIAESKCKPARKFYPDTGIDLRHYDDYHRIQDRHETGVFLFFVDECAGSIYGGWLHALEQERSVTHNGKLLSYPIRDRGIIYFPLIAMESIAVLSAEERAELASLAAGTKPR